MIEKIFFLLIKFFWMSLPPPHTFKKDATCLNLPLIDTIFLFFLIYQSPFPFTTIENN